MFNWDLILSDSGIMLMVSFFITVVIAPFLIPLLKQLKFGQTVRDDGPKTHLVKMGTPTMGGVIFIVSMIILSLCYMLVDIKILPLALVTLGFGLVGFTDDFIKIIKKRKDGLYPKQKMFGLLLVATIFSVYVAKTGIGTDIVIPFVKNARLDLAYLFIPFSILVLISVTNAVNITDGLDGLATGITTIVMIFFMFATDKYQQYEYIKIFSSIMAGSCLGFLIFNRYPAKVFMGDTGSLALGGAIGAMAILMKNPLILIIVGGVYLVETLSVVIQVISFKTRGKRVFKMAPIHHHFELSGWEETKVVIVFWICTLLLCWIGLISLGVQ